MLNRSVLVTVSGLAGVALWSWAVLINAQTDPVGWPQFGGPTRDFRILTTPLADDWYALTPTPLWARSLGEGYSSILVDDDRLVTMYREDNEEVVIALAADSGETRWRYAYEAPLLHDGYFEVWLNSAGPGPYATPVLADGAVFTIGVNGQLHALDARTGSLRWQENLVERFDLVDYNAFASSPLAFEGTVILPLGGSGQGVVAFDQQDGSVVWQSEPFDLGPGSPSLIELDGRSQLVVLGQQEVVGLDPRDGHRLWSHPHPNELGLNISVPLWDHDERLFVSSAYDGGSRLIRLSHVDGRTTAEEVWSTNRMRVHFGNAVRVGRLILGSTGDFGPAFLAALDIDTGEEVWRERTFARAHLLEVDGRVVIVDEDGELAVASVNESGLEVHMRMTALTENAWTPPTLVDGVLYLRDRSDIRALVLRP